MSDPIPPGFAVDVRAARTRFARAAERGTEDVVAREVGRRMAERLQLIKYEPRRILDAGSGRGEAIEALRGRYPAAEIVAVDFVPALLAALRPDRSLAGRVRALVGGVRTHPVAARVDRLPFAGSSFGFLWSNLALPWVADFPAVFAEWSRVLEAGGLVMFSTYGPDTLKELRGAWQSASPAPRVQSFVDMHDLGDMLLAAGFAEPVMDVERLTLTYPSFDALAAELRATGQSSSLAGRPRGLTTHRVLDRVRQAYPAQAVEPRRLAVTVEVVYGHAWKGEPRRVNDGRSLIQVHRKPRMRP